MLTSLSALIPIPAGLRDPLVSEFKSIINNFMEHKWTAAELSGGKFCEIVYTIVDGYSKSAYPAAPCKPPNFVQACRQLEQNTNVPRSFQILIPRLLPALYEIRNNRNVGHVGGDVDPDFMDSSVVVSMTSWILSELIRVFHGVSTHEAQKVVDMISERKIPLVWESGNIRRVLLSGIALKEQIFLLLGSSTTNVSIETLFTWIECSSLSYLRKLLRPLHKQRLLEYNEKTGDIKLLPPGNEYVSKLILKYEKTK